MKEKEAAIISSMNQYLTGTTVEEISRTRGDRFRYPIYMGKTLMETDLMTMELSVRSYNCLKRAGFSTVGDLVNGIDGKKDLLKIRNLGRKSADEIMLGLFYFQYDILPVEKRERYMKRVRELNMI